MIKKRASRMLLFLSWCSVLQPCYVVGRLAFFAPVVWILGWPAAGSFRGQHDRKSSFTLKVCLGSEVSVMGDLTFWLGIGAAQRGGIKELKFSRHPIVAFVVGTLIALAIIAGMFALLAYQR